MPGLVAAAGAPVGMDGAGVLAAQPVALDDAGRWVLLRELTGADELSVADRSTLSAVRLVDRLLVGHPEATVQPGEAELLTVPERDLVLAGVWRANWGPGISGTITCTVCAAPFDVDFDLAMLAESARAALASLPHDPDGWYRVAGERAFRLPNGADELAVWGLPTQQARLELAARCLAGQAAPADPQVETLMAQVGAGMDVDLAARCPECGATGEVRFAMQDYLLAAISRSEVVPDVHRLALAYHWGLGEVLGLSRRQRRAFLALLDGNPLSAFDGSPLSASDGSPLPVAGASHG